MLIRIFYSNSRWFESDKIHAKALIVSENCTRPSHFQSTKSIDTWLKEQGVTGLAGVDTRALTRILREAGSTMARIVLGEPTPDDLKEIPDLNLRNLVAEVSTTVSFAKKLQIHNVSFVAVTEKCDLQQRRQTENPHGPLRC